MRSCIYEGYTEHQRVKPAEHRFRYNLYFYCFDLDELQELDRHLLLFAYNRFRPVSLHDKDYLDEEPGTIREKLLKRLDREVDVARIKRILLITSARYFNYIFNPVSFYYCLTQDNDLLAVVAEVNNTFNEKHLYVLKNPEVSARGYAAHYRTDKAFHVSPFNSTAGHYEFFFSEPGEEIDIRIVLHRDGGKIFEAQLWGKSQPLTSVNLAAIMLKHPLLPHLSVPRIFLEAGKLFFQKKLSYLDKPIPMSMMTIRKNPPGLLEKACSSIVVKLLEKISVGALTLRLPDGRIRTFGDNDSDLRATITVHDYGFFTKLVAGGDVGMGEAFVQGLWDTQDIPTLFRLLIKNRDVFKNGYPATAWLKRRKNDLLHLLRTNSLKGARRNIQSHYDLSNDLFGLFLDESMTYSNGVYCTDTDTLEEAQRRKLQMMVEKGRIQETDEVLEIGCGWGGFAIHAAIQTGCRVTGITISEAQHRFAQDRVEKAGLQDRIRILLQDYRKIKGRFDKIVSVEMLEAVGEKYLGIFFRHCDRLLKPGGLLVLQVITIPDQSYQAYRKETDWIQKHIFPGGLLPSVTALLNAATRNSTLVMENLEDIGRHYARTLKDWRERFTQRRDRLPTLGFDGTFERKWIYYLATCEAGFTEQALGDVQVVFRKPR
ncbi:s-adenosyl-l-methionine dependent methyltransferase [hydrocarbon metagenome]|uniref:S-adenosyl-l-methionine dependent methyltransferase n=1 Tax=hydrocarbon metagenome TaxID=938273 RepID=A0A0W8FPZ3_9ZZZZ